MKAAIEAMRNKEMGSYKACRVFNLPQTKLQSYVKDGQESSSEASETPLAAEHCTCKKQLYTNDLVTIPLKSWKCS
jgi:hypothetical protein